MADSADTLARVIAYVESGNNPYALRFEPAVYARVQANPTANEATIERIAAANECNHATAEIIFSTSWGLYQIMGESLYPQGWSRSVGFYLANSATQTLAFSRFLDADKLPSSWPALKSDPGSLRYFAARYNGPEEPDAYAQRMLDAARLLGV
jgi:hypothetical protein